MTSSTAPWSLNGSLVLERLEGGRLVRVRLLDGRDLAFPHLERVYAKLGVETRTAAARVALSV